MLLKALVGSGLGETPSKSRPILLYSAMIPKPKFGGEAALVKHVQWEDDEEKMNVNGNPKTVGSDDGDAQSIIPTPEESGPPVLEEEEPDSAAMSVYTREGIAVARRIWGQFWSPEYKHFRTRGKTAETVRWP